MYRLKFTSSLTEKEFNDITQAHPWWYHSFYFDNGFAVRGDYNIGADVQDYGFPNLSGLKVLDIGTGGGWFAHYFAQQGAEVTTYDARGYSDFDVYGRPAYPPIASEKPMPDRYDEEGNPVYFSPVSKTFWIMQDILNTKIRYKNGRVYDIRPEVFGGEKFDVVFMGALLLHLRDPIGAMMAAHSVCKGMFIANTLIVNEPEDQFEPRQYLPWTKYDRISWWQPNEACFRHWFQAAGFQNVDISREITLRCDLERELEGRIANADQLHRVGLGYV